MHPKMSYAQVVCCIYLLALLAIVNEGVNNVDPGLDQTAPIGVILSGSTLCEEEAS